MIARVFMLILVFVLALPTGALTRPTDALHLSWDTFSQEAEAKKKKKGKKTVTRIVRQPASQAFASAAPITIADNSPANPYPAPIEVSGFANGTITDVNLILNDLTHGAARDVNILLARVGLSQNATVMNEVGDGSDVTDLDLTLDDEAAQPLPNGVALTSGAFRPADHGGGEDFPPGAPPTSGVVALSAFDGADPNGTWQLWVFDDDPGDAGDIGGGWALQITADVDVSEQVQVPKKKKKKGRG